MTTVVNIRQSRYDVYCGRPGPWGNRYRIGRDGGRSEVIAKHRRELNRKIAQGGISLEELAALSGKRLGCYCAPKPCHAGSLAKAADAAAAALGAISRFQANGAAPQAAAKARELARQSVAAQTGNITLEPDGTLVVELPESSGAVTRHAIKPDDGAAPARPGGRGRWDRE